MRILLSGVSLALIISSTLQSDCSEDELYKPIDSEPGDFLIAGIFNVGNVSLLDNVQIVSFTITISEF